MNPAQHCAAMQPRLLPGSAGMAFKAQHKDQWIRPAHHNGAGRAEMENKPPALASKTTPSTARTAVVPDQGRYYIRGHVATRPRVLWAKNARER